jgi:hypothetical protein
MKTAQLIKTIDAEVQRLREIRALLDPSRSSEPAAKPPSKPGKRQVSAAGRARMAAAQKARWAKAKAAGK